MIGSTASVPDVVCVGATAATPSVYTAVKLFVPRTTVIGAAGSANSAVDGGVTVFKAAFPWISIVLTLAIEDKSIETKSELVIKISGAISPEI